MNPPKIPIHIGDYMRDTGHLRAAEHGAYLMLLFHYWSTGSVPDDDRQLAAIARMSGAEWKRARPTIERFFDPGWHHGRVEFELAKAAKISEAASDAGKASGRSRSVERPLNDRSLSVERPLNDRSLSVERPLNDRSSSVERPLNDRSSSVERPLNDRSSSVERPLNDRSSSVERSFVIRSSSVEPTLEPYNHKKEDTADAVPTKYAFESGVIRLSERDFNQWKSAFSHLDLNAELLALTEWAASQPKWFYAVSGALAKRNRAAKLAAERNEKSPQFKYNGMDGIV